MGWAAKPGYELVLDDSDSSVTFPEFGILVGVIERMASSVCGQKVMLP